jgi:ABC-type antimicrobial peptide transport system permease subunit
VQGLLLRVDGDPTRSIMAVRQAIVGTRTDLPFLQIRPYAELLDRQMDPWRLATALLALFGALALSVAAVGLYAAFAHAVGERRHEMAVRLAVGGNPGRVLVLVQREAAIVAAAGIVAGSTLAVLGGRSLSSMLVYTAPADPLVFALAAALMLSVSAAATFLPARTAARTDPTSLLRSE